MQETKLQENARTMAIAPTINSPKLYKIRSKIKVAAGSITWWWFNLLRAASVKEHRWSFGGGAVGVGEGAANRLRTPGGPEIRSSGSRTGARGRTFPRTRKWNSEGGGTGIGDLTQPLFSIPLGNSIPFPFPLSNGEPNGKNGIGPTQFHFLAQFRFYFLKLNAALVRWVFSYKGTLALFLFAPTQWNPC